MKFNTIPSIKHNLKAVFDKNSRTRYIFAKTTFFAEIMIEKYEILIFHQYS